MVNALNFMSLLGKTTIDKLKSIDIYNEIFYCL